MSFEGGERAFLAGEFVLETEKAVICRNRSSDSDGDDDE